MTLEYFHQKRFRLGKKPFASTQLSIHLSTFSVDDNRFLARADSSMDLSHGARVDQFVEHESCARVERHFRRGFIHFVTNFGRDFLLFVRVDLRGRQSIST